MSEIFISYSREDIQSAQRLAEGLEREGLSVFWDRDIPPGTTWDQYIGNALQDAKCVIVLWSAASVQSDWVKEEAARGARGNRLVPILIESVEIPLGFGRIEAADLVGWLGDPAHPEYKHLLRSIGTKLDRPLSQVGPAAARAPGPGVGASFQTGAGGAAAASRPHLASPASGSRALRTLATLLLAGLGGLLGILVGFAVGIVIEDFILVVDEDRAGGLIVLTSLMGAIAGFYATLRWWRKRRDRG